MKKYIFSIILAFASTFSSFANQPDNLYIHPLDNMPIIGGSSSSHVSDYAPEPKRSGVVFGNEPIWKILAPSVRIRSQGSSGSGTICYYDRAKNIAYIISCGHLFSYSKAPQDATKTCIIEVFYHNEKKLNEPDQYTAEIICTDSRRDISFLKFTPKWEPIYIPIAPVDYKIRAGDVLESTGCDKATETAAYTVSFAYYKDGFMYTDQNGARPGRSGGSITSKDFLYVGIVVRTTDVSGNGQTLSVPLDSIHKYAAQFEEIKFLLNVHLMSQKIFGLLPIVDGDTKNIIKDKDYIPY